MAYKTPPFALMIFVTFNCAQFTQLPGNLFIFIDLVFQGNARQWYFYPGFWNKFGRDSVKRFR